MIGGQIRLSFGIGFTCREHCGGAAVELTGCSLSPDLREAKN
jgi:hypothetical protein